MRKVLGAMLLVAGLCSIAVAGPSAPAAAPEIDGMTAVSALTLITGAVLLIRGRRH